MGNVEMHLSGGHLTSSPGSSKCSVTPDIAKVQPSPGGSTIEVRPATLKPGEYYTWEFLSLFEPVKVTVSSRFTGQTRPPREIGSSWDLRYLELPTLPRLRVPEQAIRPLNIAGSIASIAGLPLTIYGLLK